MRMERPFQFIANRALWPPARPGARSSEACGLHPGRAHPRTAHVQPHGGKDASQGATGRRRGRSPARLPQPASLTAGPALPIRSRRARTGATPCSPQGPQRYPSRSACRTPLPKALPEGRPQGPSRTRLPKLPKDLAQSACRTQRGQAPPLSTLEHRRAPQRAPSPCRPRLLAKPPPMCPRLPRAAQTSTSTASASRILGHADHAGCLAGG